MAIYHFSAKMISRSTGRSAVAAAAYRTGVLSSEILVPEGTPDSMKDRATLWNVARMPSLPVRSRWPCPTSWTTLSAAIWCGPLCNQPLSIGAWSGAASRPPPATYGARRGADFTALKETNDYVREQEREVERSAEKERDIGIDRERGHSL